MSEVLLCCPHCQYSKKILASKIPPGAKRVTCPSCGEAFPLAEAIRQDSSVEPQAQEEQPLISAAPEASVAVAESEPSSVSSRVSRPEAPEERRIGFEFQGTAKDYFGIWIVNTLLKIVTLGIYSPWAKVRKRSYFYGCTNLDGLNFDYLANPIALLKGWLIGAALFLLYTVGANFSPLLSGIVGLLIFILMPWAIVRSRVFNNRNSAHRNIRFNFFPDYNGAYFAYFWLPMLLPLTMGLAAPYMIYRQKRFLVENNSFGKTSFSLWATSKDYYLLCLRGLVIILLLVAGGFFLIRSLVPHLYAMGASASGTPQLLGVLMPVYIFLGYLLVAIYFYVRITNLTWNNCRLGKHRFESSLKAREMSWIFFSNGVAILLSFGLLTPWATIRLTRYRLERLTLVAQGSLAEFEAFNRPEVSAAGEEIGEMFGMEIGL